MNTVRRTPHFSMLCDKMNTVIKWLENRIFFQECDGIDTRLKRLSCLVRSGEP